MKRSQEAESSLELLLDTMCNTFGGVMFIAIALVVVLSISSRIKVEEAENTGMTQQRLEQLMAELERLKRESTVQTELLDLQKNDPRQELVKEIILLEAQLNDLDRQKEKINAAVLKQAGSNRAREEKQKTQQDEVRKLEEQLQEAQVKNTDMNRQLAQLQEEIKKIVSGHITFKTLTATRKEPYFLIVNNNRIWRVGPGSRGEDPEEDVKFQESGNQVHCRINEDVPGVPLLKDGHISPEARELLKNIPDDRFPDFSLHSNSAADFFIFREELKKADLAHGVNVIFEYFNGTFVYIYTKEKVKHEIY